MHIHWRAVDRLGECRLDGIAQDAGDAPQIGEFAELDGLAVLRAGDHRGYAFGDFVHGAGKHDDLHEFAGRGEHHALGDIVLAGVDGDLAQRTGRDLGDTRHEHGVEFAFVHSLFSEGNEQVLRGLDCGHFAAQAPVDEFRVGQGRLAAAGRAALGTGCGDAHARLAQHGGRVDATCTQRVNQCDGGGGFAFATGRLQWRISGDEHDFAMFTRRFGMCLEIVEVAVRVDLADQSVLACVILDTGHGDSLPVGDTAPSAAADGKSGRACPHCRRNATATSKKPYASPCCARLHYNRWSCQQLRIVRKTDSTRSGQRRERRVPDPWTDIHVSGTRVGMHSTGNTRDIGRLRPVSYRND